MTVDQPTQDYAVGKAVAAAAGAGASATLAGAVDLISQIGAVAGALVAIWVFLDRVWAKVIRPFCVRRKWLKPLKRRAVDRSSSDE